MNKTGKYILATLGAFLAYNILRGQSSIVDPNYSYLNADCSVPRGIRNNNPGNLKVSNSPWMGKLPLDQNQDYNCNTGRVARTFEQFTAYKYGIRALVKLLKNYIDVTRLKTISQIINRYAPSTENNPAAYINYVSSYTGISPNTPLSPSRETLRALARSIAAYENGTEAISDTEFYAVWNEFFSDSVAGHYLGYEGCAHEVCGHCGGIVPGVMGIMDICSPNCLSARGDGPCECKCGGAFHSNPRRLNRFLDALEKKKASISGIIDHPAEELAHGMIIETTSLVPFINHCGIIQEMADGVFVAHNTPYRGVVLDPIEDFFKTRSLLAIKNQFHGLKYDSIAHFLGRKYNLITFNCYDFVDSVAFCQFDSKSCNYAES